ncbi:MAG TPA: transposase, partial [Ktedonobacteraceae bacterium]|nr:transposase [Ktedonobacteraceae bacterium]
MFQYRISPTKKQERQLEAILEECRWLYNHLLERRREAYEQNGKGLSCYEQQATYPILKQERCSLDIVHSQVLQNVAVRIDLAFQAFFRRCKAGEHPGYPRFKGKGRYQSMTFPQIPSGCSLKDGKLVVSKVGTIKMVLHRALRGKPKTSTISKGATGKWYVCFSCEVEPERLSENAESVGIDVGL